MHTGMTDIELKTLKDNLWHSADKLRAGAHLAAKNLYKKLMGEKERVMVVDWYKDEQPKKKVLALIQISLDKNLPESYDRAAFTDKTNLLMNHFIDMAVQGYGWTAAKSIGIINRDYLNILT